jgi:hypothetical protein
VNIVENSYYIEKSVPIWEKFTLTVEEAAKYFRIGEAKLRRIIDNDKNAEYLLWNGNRPQIKRQMFEKVVNGMRSI